MKRVAFLLFFFAFFCFVAIKMTPVWDIDIFAGAPIHIDILDRNEKVLYSEDLYTKSIHFRVKSDFVRVIVDPIEPGVTVAKMIIKKNYIPAFEMERVIQYQTIPWQVDAHSLPL